MRSGPIVLGVVLVGALAAGGQYGDPRRGAPLAPLGMQRDLDEIVAVRDVARRGQTVMGRVVNRSDVPIADVELEVEQVFLWKDEHHPGRNDPSRRETLLLRRTIDPGESATFHHRLTVPLPVRSDGSFMTKVEPTAVTQYPPAY